MSHVLPISTVIKQFAFMRERELTLIADEDCDTVESFVYRIFQTL